MRSAIESFRSAGCAALLACGPLASASAAAQVTLNANSWLPPTHALSAAMITWCADVEKATAGRVKCGLLPKAVVQPPQSYDAIRDGIADLAVAAHGHTPRRFPLTAVAELPLLGDSAETVSVAYQRIHERVLAKGGEHKGVVVLAVFTHGPGQIFNARRPVASLKDLEGLKFRVGEGRGDEVARAIGANPLRARAGESYAMLSSGAVDGVFLPKEAVLSLKLTALIRHATYVPGGLYNASFVFMMNPRKWSQIAKTDQDAIATLSGEDYARRAGRAWDVADAQADAALREAKISVLKASPVFVAEIKAKSAGLEKAWLEKARAKGIDGEATLKALRAEIAALSRN